MNRISANITGAMARIYEIGRERAEGTKPVANVVVPSAVGYTVADQLDLDAQTNGRSAIIKVANYEGVKAQIQELRQNASASMKRSYGAFLTALEEAYTHAEETHATTMANDIAQLMNGTARDGRPLASYRVEMLVTLHNNIVDWLLNPTMRKTVNYNGVGINCEAQGLLLTVVTSARFDLRESNVVVDYRHQLTASGLLRSIQGMLSAEGSVYTSRHNSDPNGAQRHAEIFLGRAREIIQAELEVRNVELASVGVDLELELTPVL
jgi:hypothetical protein